MRKLLPRTNMLNHIAHLQAVAGADHNISVISIVEARVFALLKGELPSSTMIMYDMFLSH